MVFSSHIMQEVSALCDRSSSSRRARWWRRAPPDELRRQTGERISRTRSSCSTGLEAEAQE